MEPVVGIFSSRSAAAHAAGDLREQGWAPEKVQLLFPESSDAKVARVPIEDAEQPGVGKALGGVVGAALHSDLRGRDILRERKGDVADTTAFRAGYERGRVSAGRVLEEANRRVPVLN